MIRFSFSLGSQSSNKDLARNKRFVRSNWAVYVEMAEIKMKIIAKRLLFE